MQENATDGKGHSKAIFEVGEDWQQDWANAPAPMVTPVYQTSNFRFKTVRQFQEALAAERSTSLYTRGENPTVSVARRKIAALENVEDGLLFSSGMAAITAGILGCVRQGGHIICVRNPYPWTAHFISNYLSGLGIRSTFVDGRTIEAFKAAWQQDTKLVFLESPNTFTFELQDLEAVAKLTRERGAVSMIDNSYCSPINQRPADFGIDLIAHSATKYLAGHSDVVAGFLGGSKTHIQDIFEQEYMTLGAILGPQDASLITRGLRTLPLRMTRIAETVTKVVEFLQGRPEIEKLYFPFLPDNPQAALADKQMKRPSGQFSVVLGGGDKAAIACCEQLKAFKMAVSWGGHESLVFPAAAKGEQNQHPGLLRFYIGLEDADYLIEDLKNALEGLKHG